MPQDDVTRELAALAAIVSIALIGITVALLPTAWRGFEQRFLKLPSIERKTVIKNMFIIFCPILIIVGTWTVIGVYWPDLVQVAVLLVMLLLTTIAIFYMIVSFILRKIGKSQKPRKPDDSALLYFAAFTFLALGIMCSLFALAGVTPTMLMIEIGPLVLRTLIGVDGWCKMASFSLCAAYWCLDLPI